MGVGLKKALNTEGTLNRIKAGFLLAFGSRLMCFKGSRKRRDTKKEKQVAVEKAFSCLLLLPIFSVARLDYF